MERSIEPLVMKTRRGDDVHPGSQGQVSQLRRIATAVGRHRVDRGAESGGAGVVELAGQLVDVGEEEVRRHLDRPTAVDDEVLVRVGHAQLACIDVAEHRPDVAHSGETEAIDQPPSIFRSCPVTAFDSSERK